MVKDYRQASIRIPELKIISINARGLNDTHKRNTLFHYLQENKIDVALIQETYITNNKYDTFTKGWDGTTCFSPAKSNHSCGVITLFRKGLDLTITNIHSDIFGRKLLVNTTIDNFDLTFINIYAPNNLQPRIDFFKNTSNWIRKHHGESSDTILGGDFNSTLSVNDRESRKIDKSSRHLHNLLKNHNLVDTLSTVPTTGNIYTFIDPTTQLGSRLDYIFCSKSISPFCKYQSTTKLPKIPDHKAVICKTKNKLQIGRGYWKMNVSYLEDVNYCKEIKQIFLDTISHTTEDFDKRTTWDIFKTRVKEYSIRHGITQSRTKRSRLSELEKLIESNSSDKITPAIQQEYDRLYSDKVHGAQIRSRAKWVEEGEQNSKFFLGLEKRHQTNNSIYQLQDDGGDLNDDNDDIMTTCKSFYKKLYTEENIDHHNIKDYISSSNNNTLNDQQAQLCEGQITISECEIAIGKMKRNKSPGLDGLPVEFYSKFWPLVKGIVLDVYNECFQNGEMSTSQKRSVISLMFKKGDRNLLKNYRPLSLTNVDYRILAFILADRLQSVISPLIGPHQTAYIKKRFMGENIRLVNDIIDYASKFNKSGILLFLDYEKAFDNLNWDFMFTALKHYGFGLDFITWIHVLYNKPEACIKINGWLTDFIEIMKGIRQGCPISAMLFILCAEFLSLQINNNPDIIGFKLPDGHAIKLSQYADDSTIILDNLQSVEPTMHTINHFCSVSGLKLNLTKTEGILIGNLKDINPPEFGFRWSKGPVRYLGIYISPSGEQLTHLNWENKKDKIQRILDNWRRRNLSVFGRIQVLKSLALSNIINSVIMTYTPPDIVKSITKLCFKFIWPRVERINRKTMILPIEHGGANMTDIDLQFKSLKAAWIPRILSAADTPWTIIPTYYFNLFGSNMFILSTTISDIKMMPALERIPEFYQQIITCYNHGKYTHKPTSVDMLLDQNIWCNTLLTDKTRKTLPLVLFDKLWINSDIITLKDAIHHTLKIKDQLYHNLKDKRTYFTTVSKILKAVKIYKYLPLQSNKEPPTILNDNKHAIYNTTHGTAYIENQRSRFFYKCMNDNSESITPLANNKWHHIFNGNLQPQYMQDTYLSRIGLIKDPTIKQFNWKYLHFIIPCRVNLYKWKISSTDSCIYCNRLHTVDHLLYDCADIKALWHKIKYIINIDCSKQNILIGNKYNSQDTIYVISLISYCIYKRYLKDNNLNTTSDITTKIKYELSYKLHTLTYLPSYIEICKTINQIVTQL